MQSPPDGGRPVKQKRTADDVECGRDERRVGGCGEEGRRVRCVVRLTEKRRFYSVTSSGEIGFGVITVGT